MRRLRLIMRQHKQTAQFSTEQWSDTCNIGYASFVSVSNIRVFILAALDGTLYLTRLPRNGMCCFGIRQVRLSRNSLVGQKCRLRFRQWAKTKHNCHINVLEQSKLHSYWFGLNAAAASSMQFLESGRATSQPFGLQGGLSRVSKWNGEGQEEEEVRARAEGTLSTKP